MTKIIESNNIDFGVVEEFKSKKVTGTISNTGTERVTLSDLISSRNEFVVNLSKLRMEPKFPASSTIYFVDDEFHVQYSDGSYATTDQGFGQAGTTDSDGKLTVTSLPSKSVTMVTPVLTADTEGTISGTALYVTTVNVYYRLSTDTLWTLFDSGITVIAGAYTATGTIATAGTYDFLVTDADDPTVRDQLDDVVVASGATGTLTMNATCVASPPEDVETEAGTLTMNATCVASPPEDA